MKRRKPHLSGTEGARSAEILSVSDFKIPPVAVFAAPKDRPAVEEGMAPVLALLARTRNVRAYTPWGLTDGANLTRRQTLASAAPLMVIAISANAIADDGMNELIESIQIGQKVIFVLLSACALEDLPLAGISHQILPMVEGNVVPVDSVTPIELAWQHVENALLAHFAIALPDEDAGALTAQETAIQTGFRHEDELASRRQPHRPAPDYDVVTAYHEK